MVAVRRSEDESFESFECSRNCPRNGARANESPAQEALLSREERKKMRRDGREDLSFECALVREYSELKEKPRGISFFPSFARDFPVIPVEPGEVTEGKIARGLSTMHTLPDALFLLVPSVLDVVATERPA